MAPIGRISWGHIAGDLRTAARKAAPGDRALLLELAAEADAKRKIALTPCDSTPIWNGKRPACSWLGEGFYGSGLIDAADATRLNGKTWASLVFSPAQFPYEAGVWKKAVVVLIDRGTGSAASEFAAVLRDNHAAVIMGSPA